MGKEEESRKAQQVKEPRPAPTETPSFVSGGIGRG